MLCLENVSRGSKTEVPRNKGGEPGIQLFLVIYALLIDIRLDELTRGWGGGGGGGGGRKKQGGGPNGHLHCHSYSTVSFTRHV